MAQLTRHPPPRSRPAFTFAKTGPSRPKATLGDARHNLRTRTLAKAPYTEGARKSSPTPSISRERPNAMTTTSLRLTTLFNVLIAAVIPAAAMAAGLGPTAFA